MNSLNPIVTEIRRAWADSAPLTATMFLMLAAFTASVAGIVLDDRFVTGVPVWLKPAKFAISIAIFCGTMAWLFRYIHIWRRFIRTSGWLFSAVLIVELIIIDVQAARGTTSHFNIATPLDGVLFSIMGTSIAILWLTTVGILVALLRQRFSDRAWGWWLRLGILVTVLGSAAGGLMVPPTPSQTAAMHGGERVATIGAHTVGGPDGGPGLPGVGWSTRHGDLRIPHFFGLHGIQILPFLGWLALRRRSGQTEGKQTQLTFVAAGSYLTFIAILTSQALRGQALVNPDGITIAALGIWLAGTATALLVCGGFDWRGHSSAAAKVMS